MSPASKSKSKDKKSKKETPKAVSKSAGPVPAGSSIPASGYNPVLGTFHTLELSPVSASSPLHSNGRFRNIDDTEEHSGVTPTGIECDSVSNNGSWSGESEDPKDKNATTRRDTIPGAENDKREKIRIKNERKHQRQKEKRAQELHEKCSGYLMSRKLESLAQQLVAMGFSQDRATAALILNEGRVEESVAWLFEGGEETDKMSNHDNLGESNLKIDISEELTQIADMEIKFRCSKQEVERAVVACEGDLVKAAKSLRELKLEPPSAPPKPEENGDPPTLSNGKFSLASLQNAGLQTKSTAPAAQQMKDEKDFNYTKTTLGAGGSPDLVAKNAQPLKRIQPKLEWAKPQQATLADKRWPNGGGSNPSISYAVTSTPLHVSSPPAKSETRFLTVGNEFKNLQAVALREPVIMVQRPQTVNGKQVPVTSTSSSAPGGTANRYPTSNVEIMKPNGFFHPMSGTRSLNQNDLAANQMYQLHSQQQQIFIPGNSPGDFPGIQRSNSSLSRTGAPPTLAVASSLGLFSGLSSAGSSGATSPVDWSTGSSMRHLHYTSVDWSLNRSLSSPKPGGLWQGLSPFMKSGSNFYDSDGSLADIQPTMFSMPSSLNGLSLGGLPDVGTNPSETSTAGSREWTSPFEGKDLFSFT